MGNSSSRMNDWDSDSDEGGGTDYEHTYNYHTSILRKSPADGFESDYDDNDDPDPGTPSPGRKLKTDDVNAASASSSSAVSVRDSGDRNKPCTVEEGSVLQKKQNSTEKGDQLRQSLQDGDAARTSNRSQPVADQGSRAEPLKENEAHAKQTSGSTRQTSDNAGQTSQGSLDSARQAFSSGQQAARLERNREESEARGGCNTDRQLDTRAEGAGAGDAELEEIYETAGEGSGEEEAPDVGSDNGSLSTITPPRIRPQSDSEYTVSEETQEDNDTGNESEEDEEEEEESYVDASDYNRVTRNAASRSSRSSLGAWQEESWSQVPAPSPAAAQRTLPRRQGMSPESYRLARKRPPTSKPEAPSKRSKPSDGITFSPNRTRYGIFDSESETEAAESSQREGRKRRAAPPSPPPPPPRTPAESRSLSVRTLRQAARKAASQFVETSRKILQDAKTTARILRESTSKRRSSITLEQEEGPSRGKKPAPEKRETRNNASTSEIRHSERITNSRQSTASCNRRGAAKRKLEVTESPNNGRIKRQQRIHVESDSDSEISDTPPNRSASWRQVRKDGGRLRKFTRSSAVTTSQPTRRSPRLYPPVPLSAHSVSLPLLPSARTGTMTPSQSSPHTAKQNNSFPSAANPFQNVTLRPSPSKAQSSGSIDSISHELAGTWSWLSPFSSLLTDIRRERPPPLTVTAGSVWARISTLAGHLSQPNEDQGRSAVSPVPETSGTRMATRSSTPLPMTAYPAHSTPRVPSLTLTGQFAQSGRFAFLLENVLQVTVVTDSITMATTSAIVITTNSQLQHTNSTAQSVAKSAGTGLAWACQDFLRRNAKGLQVCEVLDTPAGGQLSSLIYHVLHVVVPEMETSSTHGLGQQRKMLLCTYLNCLKHASEKLHLQSLAFPLIGADTYSADECIQVFFDSLLVYLAERMPTCPLHAVHLVINNLALARFTAEVLEARLQALKASSVDAAMAAVFRDYFNIPDFTRTNGPAGGAVSPQVSADRSPSGKPAVKRRRL